jgi:polyphosphate kinase 2 (PPK2 family)
LIRNIRCGNIVRATVQKRRTGLIKAPKSRYRVPDNGSFRISSVPTLPTREVPGRKVNKQRLKDINRQMQDLQRILYAHDRYALLLIFQAVDAAGKDSTIRAVMSGVNPAGCQVYSFKQPTSEELDHDFLWRTSRSLPERGRNGIFNRS